MTRLKISSDTLLTLHLYTGFCPLCILGDYNNRPSHFLVPSVPNPGDAGAHISQSYLIYSTDIFHSLNFHKMLWPLYITLLSMWTSLYILLSLDMINSRRSDLQLHCHGGHDSVCVVVCSCLFTGLTAAPVNLIFGMHTHIRSNYFIGYII